MTADLEFAVPLGLMPPPTDAPPHGRVVELTPKPTLPILPVPSAASSQADEAADVTARWLIGGACVLLAGLALAMGVTSFHAQFAYIFATKRQWAPAVLEALGLDAGAVIFSLLGIALARLGRRAAVERGLVVICALGSCGMNVLNANLGSPRSVAVYAMPPVLFALTSDRLIAVIRRAALSRHSRCRRSAVGMASGRPVAALRHALRSRSPRNSAGPSPGDPGRHSAAGDLGAAGGRQARRPPAANSRRPAPHRAERRTATAPFPSAFLTNHQDSALPQPGAGEARTPG